jgi:hypothetical protein
MPAKYFAVIVRLDRTIQYAAGAGGCWMSAFADMTTENVEGT